MNNLNFQEVRFLKEMGEYYIFFMYFRELDKSGIIHNNSNILVDIIEFDRESQKVLVEDL